MSTRRWQKNLSFFAVGSGIASIVIQFFNIPPFYIMLASSILGAFGVAEYGSKDKQHGE